MTYGVPYSFVPGTKAKADEVNANFIDVLTKIEDTNLRIDEVNSNADSKNAEISSQFEEVESTLAQRANLDLSNLSDTGKAVLSAKANATDLDGNWTYKFLALSNASTLSNTANTTYSLASYLPNDGRTYEVLFSFGGSATAASQYNIDTGFGTVFCFAPIKTNISGCMILPVTTRRTIVIQPTSLTSGTNKYSFRVNAYRKVR